MRKLAIVLLMIVCLSCVFCACDIITPSTYTVSSEENSYTVTVGQVVDLKDYFTITNDKGEGVLVTDEMIDAPNADFTKAGAFIVTCSYEGASKSIIVIVQAEDNNQGGDDNTNQGGSDNNDQGGTVTPPSGDTTHADLSDVFANYIDYEQWNFELKFSVDADKASIANVYAYTLIYLYDGYNFYYTDEQNNFVDYVVYTDTDILYYYDNEDGTYTKLSYNDNYDEFYEIYYGYLDWVDLALLGNYDWVQSDDHYSATSPSDAGNDLFGEYESCTYTAVDLYIANGKVTKIVATQQDDYYDAVFTYTVQLSNYDTVTVDVSNLNVVGDTTDDNTGGDNTGEDVTPPSGDNQELTTTFETSTGATTLNSTGEVSFVASRKVDGWDANRGVQFQKQLGGITLTSTTNVDNVSSITIDISANKTTDITVTVKVGSTVFTCDGQSEVVFQNINNNILTFTSTTAVSGKVVIEVVPAKTNASGLGSIYFKTITISATGAGDSSTPSKEVMPEQAYDSANHQDYDDILYDAITNYDTQQGYLASTGLPSQGNYNVLVVPVEFSNDKFTTQELTDIANVFNNKANTGWESVASYYQTSSYGKLNMTFDVADKVTLSSTYGSFETDKNGISDYGGDIVKLALDQLYARGFDFTKYDVDQNGVIDGVYIIYSAPIDYDGDYYWAYVTGYTDDLSYGDLDAYTYLFASVDFMYEDIETSDPNEFSPIAGLKLNATTYIHETGHMLGLDDYYDYNPNQGSDKGLGGADMMDYTVGDHNAYSKLLLGWVKPTAVVTGTQTITISSLESSGQFVIVLLDYDGTYFSEYLIIDLYSATGLNALHAGLDDSYLYDGASFGARIYHVDATIANPYGDEYYSFTDNNNSTSATPLLKLVEADGDSNFESDQVQDIYGDYFSCAAADDLWQTGDVFSQAQPNYTRNDGKLVNFDISFDSVTADSLTITITFADGE